MVSPIVAVEVRPEYKLCVRFGNGESVLPWNSPQKAEQVWVLKVAGAPVTIYQDIMTLSTLAQKIRHLTPKEQTKLFDKLAPSLEDYLLGKIADDRLQKSSRKRVAWDVLKP